MQYLFFFSSFFLGYYFTFSYRPATWNSVFRIWSALSQYEEWGKIVDRRTQDRWRYRCRQHVFLLSAKRTSCASIL